MPKLFSLCCLVLALTLGACANNDPGNSPSAGGGMEGPAGSEIARPGPHQAGVLGR